MGETYRHSLLCSFKCFVSVRRFKIKEGKEGVKNKRPHSREVVGSTGRWSAQEWKGCAPCLPHFPVTSALQKTPWEPESHLLSPRPEVHTHFPFLSKPCVFFEALFKSFLLGDTFPDSSFPSPPVFNLTSLSPAVPRDRIPLIAMARMLVPVHVPVFPARPGTSPSPAGTRTPSSLSSVSSRVSPAGSQNRRGAKTFYPSPVLTSNKMDGGQYVS